MYNREHDEGTGYEEFRIELSAESNSPNPSIFKLTATSAGGETLSFDYYSPLKSIEIEEAFAGVTRANTQFALSAARSTSDEVRALGERLYDSIWQSGVTDLYERSSALAREQRKNLRLRFVINHPQLTALPWEFLFDPRRKDFLSLSTRTPLTRQWPWENRPASYHAPAPVVEAPLRVLVVEAEVMPWDIGTSKREIDSLRELADRQPPGLELVNVVHEATGESLIEALTSSPCHVLHLCLSGAAPETVFNSNPNQASAGKASLPESLLVRDDKGPKGRPARVDLDILRTAIGSDPELQLVYLSGDYTDWLASQLTQSSPATIGWRGFNTAEAYLAFQEGFYEGLIRGLPLEAAVTHGRKRIDARYAGGKEWGMPVFYLQTPTGFVMKQPQSDYLEASHSQSIREYTGPSSPAHQREWKKMRLQLSLAEENFRALSDQLRKYEEGAAPSYLRDQHDELQVAIASLRENLETGTQ